MKKGTRALVYGICIVIILILQSTVAGKIEIFGVKPNLMLIFIVSVALIGGSVQGAAVGFALGLMQDIMSGKLIGFYSLLGMYLGLIMGTVNKRLYRENFFIIIFFTFVSTIIYEGLVYFLNTFLKGTFDMGGAFANVIFPEAIYNMVASVFIYLIVVKINQKMEIVEEEARKH